MPTATGFSESSDTEERTNETMKNCYLIRRSNDIIRATALSSRITASKRGIIRPHQPRFLAYLTFTYLVERGVTFCITGILRYHLVLLFYFRVSILFRNIFPA